MAFADVAAKLVRGAADAAGNKEAASQVGAYQQDRADNRNNELQLQIAPLSQQLSADRLRLAAYVDPKTLKPLAGHEDDYQTTLDRMAGTIGQMRTLMGGHAPHEDPNGLKLAAAKLLDRTHITNDLANHLRSAQPAKVDEWKAENQRTAEASGAGVAPYELTEAGQSAAYQRETQIKVAEARLEAAGWTKNGNPTRVNGQWMQPFVNKQGETMMSPMPEGYEGPNTKPVKGTLVRSKQSPTGFAQTYIDPMNPGKVVAWQPITPSRYYEGTETSSTTVDPAGVTSTSKRVTNPLNGGQVSLGPEVDLSGTKQMPAEEGQAAPTAATPTAAGPAAPSAQAAPTASPKTAGPKTKQLQAKRDVSQLDENGHIPESSGANPQLRQAANQLLDGMDIAKLQIPARDKQAAADLAGKYGWEQGKYTPRELTQFKVATAFLQQFHDSPSLSVLDSYVSREKIARAMDPKGGMIDRAIAKNLTGPEAEFVRFYNSALGTIQGLTSITRAGRATEAAVGRLKMELPSIMQSANSTDARLRLEQLFKELDLATQKDSPSGARTQQLKQTQKSGAPAKLTAKDLEDALGG